MHEENTDTKIGTIAGQGTVKEIIIFVITVVTHIVL